MGIATAHSRSGPGASTEASASPLTTTGAPRCRPRSKSGGAGSLPQKRIKNGGAAWNNSADATTPATTKRRARPPVHHRSRLGHGCPALHARRHKRPGRAALPLPLSESAPARKQPRACAREPYWTAVPLAHFRLGTAYPTARPVVPLIDKSPEENQTERRPS